MFIKLVTQHWFQSKSHRDGHMMWLTSMLLTDIGGGLFWWQPWDVDDRSRALLIHGALEPAHFSPTSFTVTPVGIFSFIDEFQRWRSMDTNWQRWLALSDLQRIWRSFVHLRITLYCPWRRFRHVELLGKISSILSINVFTTNKRTNWPSRSYCSWNQWWRGLSITGSYIINK